MRIAYSLQNTCTVNIYYESLSFKEDLFRFCFALVNRTFLLILVFYRD